MFLGNSSGETHHCTSPKSTAPAAATQTLSWVLQRFSISRCLVASGESFHWLSLFFKSSTVLKRKPSSQSAARATCPPARSAHPAGSQMQLPAPPILASVSSEPPQQQALTDHSAFLSCRLLNSDFRKHKPLSARKLQRFLIPESRKDSCQLRVADSTAHSKGGPAHGVCLSAGAVSSPSAHLCILPCPSCRGTHKHHLSARPSVHCWA